ncbi:hypothetical protein ALMP_43210 [Streptomyces sp. A012304]|nr:hypothetical protein ALMP_43210 [Streptomyces sp. A012304]
MEAVAGIEPALLALQVCSYWSGRDPKLFTHVHPHASTGGADRREQRTGMNETETETEPTRLSTPSRHFGAAKSPLPHQAGPPAAGRARWRPRAAAAPCLRHRSGGPRHSARNTAKVDSQSTQRPDQPERQDQAEEVERRPHVYLSSAPPREAQSRDKRRPNVPHAQARGGADRDVLKKRG